ncbi:MFS transporter [Kribbella sandramycini]|uniref:MFS transporter n=1 Tax=Kribbella sandramycini TaxID=60450 RepID=A0A7Y4L7E4_9ACTN|nr:MFS transporter [Kribbella sandramycini]MBB6566974.1 DHA2 family multidrug resistance protein-like MFS transporter [Kribbella sandramycini]NOL44696.1 MFS transporter [Kribbella sandramycini]
MSLRSTAGPREWLGLAVLVLPTLLLAMDATILYLALPSLSADLRPSPSELLWITDAYGFLVAGFLVTMGTLGDRIGRRRLLLIGAAAFLATSILAACAISPTMLIIARALLGIAGATLMPSTLALISNMFADGRQRGTAIGIWAAGLSGGVALGPVVGGVLLEWFWWGSAFLVAVPVMALLLIAGPLLLPEYRDPQPGILDLGSVLLSLGSVLPFIFGIKQLAEGQLAPAAAGLVVGVVLGVFFVRRQRGLSAPLVDVGLFGSPRFRGALIVLLGALAAVAGGYLFVSLYLQQGLALSPLRAGLWLLPSAAAMILTSILSPALAQRIPAGRLMGFALLLSAIGFLVLTQVNSALAAAAGLVVIYLGQGPIMALGTELVVSSAPPARAGAASALSETSVEFGLAFGVAVLGSIGLLIERSHGFTDGLAVVAVIGAAACLALAAVAFRSIRTAT